MLVCAEEDCLSVGVGRLVEYGVKVFKKDRELLRETFGGGSVDHVTCLGVFANGFGCLWQNPSPPAPLSGQLG
jgi:hypothetical protein